MLDLIRAKRTVRQFTDRPVKESDKELIIEAALRSPTSRNRLPWSFIVVDDSDLLKALAACKPHGQRRLSAHL